MYIVPGYKRVRVLRGNPGYIVSFHLRFVFQQGRSTFPIFRCWNSTSGEAFKYTV